MHLSICNINIPPRAFDTLPFPGSSAFDKSAVGVGNLTDRTSDQTRALSDFSEQEIASVTEWLTKNSCRNSGTLLNLITKFLFAISI